MPTILSSPMVPIELRDLTPYTLTIEERAILMALRERHRVILRAHRNAPHHPPPHRTDVTHELRGMLRALDAIRVTVDADHLSMEWTIHLF